MITAVTGATVYTKETSFSGTLLVRDGRIEAVGPAVKIPTGARLIDAAGCHLLPGFIDVHVHGADQVDVMEGADAVRTIARFKVHHGVTAFVPTTLTAPIEQILAAAEGIAQASRQQTADATLKEARVVGAHLEGPFLSPDFTGAQPAEHLLAPRVELVEQSAAILGDLFKLMTLAPELPGATDVIRRLRELGVRPSAGHTAASTTEFVTAVEAGMTHVTHTFNAMRGIHHREPGIPTIAAGRTDVLCELICDLVHVHTEVLRLFIRAKSAAGCILVTDATSATGGPDGTYTLGGHTVTVADGICRTATGALAGSTLTMDQGVRNLVNDVGLTLGEAALMAATNPARALGLDDRKGSLADGLDADLVILGPDLQVRQTLIAEGVGRRS